MADRHAILSPSAAYRWLACTPSARFEEQIPEEENLYAAEGTLAHELAAVLLLEKTGGRVDDDTLKAIKANPLYSSEMQEYCEGYASFVPDWHAEYTSISNMNTTCLSIYRCNSERAMPPL